MLILDSCLNFNRSFSLAPLLVCLSCGEFFLTQQAIAQTLDSLPITEENLLSPSPNPLELPTEVDQVKENTVIKLTLEEALELAHKNNRQLQIVKQQLLQAELNVKVAKASYFPNLGLGLNLNNAVNSLNSLEQKFYDNLYSSVGLNYNQIQSQQLIEGPKGFTLYSLTPDDEPLTTFDTTLTFSYFIYSGGKRSGNLQVAEEQLKVQTLQVELQQQELDLQTRNAYYDVQNAQGQIEIAKANLKNAEISFQDAQALKEAALATIADVLQAEVQVKNAQQELAQAQGDLISAQSSLTQILSIVDEVTVTVASEIALEGEWNLSLEETLLLAYQQRPELKQQLAQQKIAEGQKQIALADTRPQIAFVAQTDVNKVLNSGEGFPQGLEGSIWGVGYSLGLQVQWNFFDGGSSRLRADSAQVDENIAVTQFANLRNQIRQEVKQAYTNLQVSQTNYQTAKEAVNVAQQNLDANRIRFRAGVGTQIDVISAQNNLNQANLNLLRAMVSYNQALASIKRASASS